MFGLSIERVEFLAAGSSNVGIAVAWISVALKLGIEREALSSCSWRALPNDRNPTAHQFMRVLVHIKKVKRHRRAATNHASETLRPINASA